MNSSSPSTDYIYKKFSSSIERLGSNDDTQHIKMLMRMINDLGIENAPRIVRRIESHLRRVKPKLLLPGILLIDSIVKNLGYEYARLFTNNIAKNFCTVCEKVDVAKRRVLFDIRKSWIGVFPNQELHTIDRRIKRFDKFWPIFETHNQKSDASRKRNADGELTQHRSTAEPPTKRIKKESNKEISENNSKIKIDEPPIKRIKKDNKNNSNVKSDESAIKRIEDIKIDETLNKPCSDDLVNKILSLVGISHLSQQQPKKVDLQLFPTSTRNVELNDIINFDKNSLKLRRDRVINVLHTGKPCSSCGTRFGVNDTKQLEEHLDWHFKENRFRKSKLASRKWYVKDWAQCDKVENNVTHDAAPCFFDLQATEREEQHREVKTTTIRCAEKECDNVCNICGEKFEDVWNDDEEEWHIKDAISRNNLFYHLNCFVDVNNYP